MVLSLILVVGVNDNVMKSLIYLRIVYDLRIIYVNLLI